MKIEIEEKSESTAARRTLEAYADDGMCAGKITAEGVREERTRITSLFVEPMYRGEGIGKKLLKELLQRARDDRYKEAVIFTARERFELNLLLQSFGFVETVPDMEVPKGQHFLLLKL